MVLIGVSSYQALAGLYKSYNLAYMFNFLNKFFLDLKKKQLLIRHFGVWNYNMLNYKNYKVMSYLSVLISQFDLLTNHKLLVISNNFSLEVFMKKWFFTFFSLIYIIIYFI